MEISPSALPWLTLPGAGRETAMKYLQAHADLAHGWETAPEGTAMEDGAAWRDGGLLPLALAAPASPGHFSLK